MAVGLGAAAYSLMAWIGFNVYAGTGFLLGTKSWAGAEPEKSSVAAQPQWQAGGGAEVEAAGGDVGLADVGWSPAKPNGQPTFFIEPAGAEFMRDMA